LFLQNLKVKLPANLVSNREFCIFTDSKFRPEEFKPETADSWIFERSGIRTRTYLDPKNLGSGVLAPEVEVNFAMVPLTHSISADHYRGLQAIITVRSNPFHFVPGLSQRLLKNLNTHFETPHHRLFTLDITQPSTGFLSALMIARALPFQSILIVCSEILSPFLNLKDPGTAMLFGDGFASVLVTKKHTVHSRFQVVDESFSSQADTGDVLKSEQTLESFHMKGPELFRKVVPEFKRSANHILSQNGYAVSDIKYYLPHQANRRILERAAHSIGFDDSQILSNIERVGNLSGASILALLAEQNDAKRFRAGERILLNACGAGLSSGAAILEVLGCPTTL
jgi:3-oxoacyl-[acyl-carrier-protein] synthase-3